MKKLSLAVVLMAASVTFANAQNTDSAMQKVKVETVTTTDVIGVDSVVASPMQKTYEVEPMKTDEVSMKQDAKAEKQKARQEKMEAKKKAPKN